MKTVAANKKLRELIVGLENGTLVARPDFQRRLVWSNKEKISFIETVLMGFPFPEIYIAAGDVDSTTGIATEYLVDGQQRITTLHHYFKGNDEIQLPATVPKYSKLSDDAKKNFLQYDVVARDLGDLPIEEIKDIFQKINATSYSLNAMEIDNARFDGAFKLFGESIAESSFFNDINFFTTNDIRRMQDLRYCLNLIGTMLTGYFNASSKLEQFLSIYNDTFDKAEEVLGRINGVFDFIKSCDFDKKSRVWNKADFFTLFIELDKAYFSKSLVPDVTSISDKLKSFYQSLEGKIETENLDDNMAKYHNAAIQGSGSRSRRIERAEVIRTLIS
jgi:hypothetical protein